MGREADKQINVILVFAHVKHTKEIKKKKNFVYLVVEKLETPVKGRAAMVKDPIHPAAIILTVVESLRRLFVIVRYINNNRVVRKV